MKDSNLIWKQGKKTELLRTPVMTVNSINSVSSQGVTGDYIVMDARDWVVVIPDDGENYLMVKQWRHGEGALSIEFPGGVIDDGEEPSCAARRELLEETGFEADELISLGTMNPNPALFSNHVHIFAVTKMHDTGKQSLDHDEFINYLKINKNEVFAKMGNSDYPHALMASALLRYMAYKNA